MLKNKTGLIVAAGLIAAVLGGYTALATTKAGTLMVASAEQMTNQNLLTGSSMASVSVGLVGMNGANANNTTVKVQVWQGASLMKEAVFHHQDILHEMDHVRTYALDLAGVAPGAYTLQVIVLNQDGSVNATFSDIATVTVGGGGPPTPTSTPPVAMVQIVPATVPGGMVSNWYSQSLMASTTASGPFMWSVSSGSLPAGLMLNTAATGTMTTLSGTPSAAGMSTFSIMATNGMSSSSQSYTVNIAPMPMPTPPPAIDILPLTLASATVSSSYAQMLTASTTATGTFNWSLWAGTLPMGLMLNTSTTAPMTAISGTPMMAGSSTFTIKVMNGASSSTKTYVLNVLP